ncbi:MAG: YcxB family protein [Candidatus Heimdallarchaeota archaeon]
MTENKKELEFTFRYEPDDYKKSFLSNYFSKKRVIFSVIISIIIIALAILHVLVNDTTITVSWNDVIFLIVVLGFLAFELFRSLNLLKALKLRWITSMQYNKEENFVIVGNEGIYFRNVIGEQRYYWTFVLKVIEQKEGFCIYLNSQEYRLIPKRVLSAEQIHKLRYLLFMHAGSKYSVQGFNKKKALGSEST